jgi:DNA-binding beta-propeller fold protein YncE
MKSLPMLAALALGISALSAGTASAEILAMLNYESKPADSLKALKLSGDRERREGIAVIDVDPASPTVGKILMDIPLDPDMVAHHIFYDRTMTKAYLTTLAKGELWVFRLDEFPYRLRKIDVPQCSMGEDVIFDEANETWYLTCMNSANVVVGAVATDEVLKTIDIPGTYPHGLGVATDIDRILVTSTISGDLKTPDESLTVLEASSGKILGSIKLSEKPSPSGEAPVEILFVPGQKDPIAYVTNMFGHSLWTASWNPATKAFEAAMAFDFNPLGVGVPLEMYFNDSGDRMYVTTANPGHFHIFDMTGDLRKPKLLKSIVTANGAHHVGFTKDFKYGFVQNSFINLPGMRDGSITVIDLEKGEAVRQIETLKLAGFNPNSLVLLPEWNHLAGH